MQTAQDLIERDHQLEHAYTSACRRGDLDTARRLSSEWSAARAAILDYPASNEIWEALTAAHRAPHQHEAR